MDAPPPATQDEYRMFFERARSNRILEKQKDWLTVQTPNFNLFRSLGLERNETRHSQWLRFLLDPHEKHEYGAVFLKFFLTRLGTFEEIVEGDMGEGSWLVETEKAIPNDRRLDITITSIRHRTLIAVENKI